MVHTVPDGKLLPPHPQQDHLHWQAQIIGSLQRMGARGSTACLTMQDSAGSLQSTLAGRVLLHERCSDAGHAVLVVGTCREDRAWSYEG